MLEDGRGKVIHFQYITMVRYRGEDAPLER
jgi:hypothetical protein